MNARRIAVITAMALALAAAPPAPGAAQRAGTPALDLSVTPATVAFTAGDPDVSPLLAATPIVVSVRVRQNSSTWTLTALAGGDLLSGSSTVDISNVTWTATPAPPFQAGTLSKTVAQRVASGTGNVNPAQNGSLTFRLANAWTYSAGNYTQTVTFTLSSP